MRTSYRPQLLAARCPLLHIAALRLLLFALAPSLPTNRALIVDRGGADGQMPIGVILCVAAQTLLAYGHARLAYSISPATLLICPMVQIRLLAGAS
jgi:hypothetical protein